MTRADIVNLESTEKRFWAKTEPEPTSGCLLWTGAINGRGYGQFYFETRAGKRYMSAHRVALLLAGHEVLDEHDACHRCDNRRCVGDSHLFQGTRAENLADMQTKGRKAIGSRNGYAKLTESEAALIRDSKERSAVLAASLGVCRETIDRVRRRSTWAHVI